MQRMRVRAVTLPLVAWGLLLRMLRKSNKKAKARVEEKAKAEAKAKAKAKADSLRE